MTGTISACRACGSSDLVEVLDLGEQYLSEFRDDDSTPPRFPLTLVMCQRCTLAQLRDTAPPAALFHDRYSFKSGVSDAVRRDLADVAQYALNAHPCISGMSRWLDIASNDGTLLSEVPDGIYRVGIDPLAQFAREAENYADRIVVDFFDPKHFDGKKFDVITAVSMFYDLHDPNEFLAGVESILAPGGILVIQQNHALAMLENNSVDNISHEHLGYYSLISMRPLLVRHGLDVIDMRTSPINGGCFRILITRLGGRPASPSMTEALSAEYEAGLDQLWPWKVFAAQVRERLTELHDFIKDINAGGKRVYVYGASTRGAVIWQAAGLDARDLPYVVDRNPDKVGRYMSAIGAPIISEEQARKDRPEYMLVGPWWLRDDFVARERAHLEAGGKLVFPLPQLEVVSA